MVRPTTKREADDEGRRAVDEGRSGRHCATREVINRYATRYAGEAPRRISARWT